MKRKTQKAKRTHKMKEAVKPMYSFLHKKIVTA